MKRYGVDYTKTTEATMLNCYNNVSRDDFVVRTGNEVIYYFRSATCFTPEHSSLSVTHNRRSSLGVLRETWLTIGSCRPH